MGFVKSMGKVHTRGYFDREGKGGDDIIAQLTHRSHESSASRE